MADSIENIGINDKTVDMHVMEHDDSDDEHGHLFDDPSQNRSHDGEDSRRGSPRSKSRTPERQKVQGKMKCYEKFEEKIGHVFARYGRFVARHPWKIIILVVLLNGLLGVGIIRLESDIDVNRVYAPMNSQAIKDEEKLQNIFPDKSGTSFYGYQLTITALSARILFKPNTGTILNIAFLDKVQELVSQIENITLGTGLQLVNICARRNGCVIDGDIFLSPEFRLAVTSGNVTYPTFARSTGEPVDLTPLVAGATVVNGQLSSAAFLYVQFNLRSDTDDFKDVSKLWQDSFIDFMRSFTSSVFDFAFAHSNSLSEELNANISGDIGLFSVTFTLMITYACVATYSASNDCIGNRMFLGFAGVMAAGLGIVASFGLVSACGMKFVSIVGNAPFLLLGIGVDGMFILLSGMADTDFTDTAENRVGHMLRTSGVAITITSLTDILAFAAGATSTFKSVRNFCVFTGVAVIFGYFNQMTFFTACIAANESRVGAKRHFISFRKTHSKKTLKERGSSKATVFCCAGRRPQSRDEIESIFEKLPRKYLPKILLRLPVKIFILILFAAYIGVSIWGVLGLEQGLVIRNLVADDSYFLKYTIWSEENFESRIPISFVMESHVDYSNTKIQNDVKSMLDRAENDEFISENSRISWLETYITSSYYDGTNEAAFIAGLFSFLGDPRFARFTNDVKIDTTNTSIVASRVYVFTKTIIKSQDNGQMMLNMRDIACDTPSPLVVTAFSPVFIIYEQYVAILPQTLQTLGVSLAAVLLITAIFMPHPLLLVYVILTMAMIMSGIVGFMSHWGLTLSSITMIHLIMSVGFSVDFTAHICHAFMVANGNNRNERVGIALQTSGGPILNGAISSILGIVMLSIAKSYIFKSFFQVMLLVVLFGVGHAILFLPTLLSFIGPSKSKQDDSEKPDYPSDEMKMPRNKISPTTSRQNSSNNIATHAYENGAMRDQHDLQMNGMGHNSRSPSKGNNYEKPYTDGDRMSTHSSVGDVISDELKSSKDVTVIYNGDTIKTVTEN